MKTFSQFIEEAFKRTGRTVQMQRLHHGSDAESVKSIQRSGPRPSLKGSEGPGHYVTPSEEKARKYAEFTSKQRKKSPGVVSYLVPKKKITTTTEIPKGLTATQKTTTEKPVIHNIRTGHVAMDTEYARRKMIRTPQPIIRKK